MALPGGLKKRILITDHGKGSGKTFKKKILIEKNKMKLKN